MVGHNAMFFAVFSRPSFFYKVTMQQVFGLANKSFTELCCHLIGTLLSCRGQHGQLTTQPYLAETYQDADTHCSPMSLYQFISFLRSNFEQPLKY